MKFNSKRLVFCVCRFGICVERAIVIEVEYLVGMLVERGSDGVYGFEA